MATEHISRCDHCGKVVSSWQVKHREGEEVPVEFDFHVMTHEHIPRFVCMGGEMRYLHSCPNATCLEANIRTAQEQLASDARATLAQIQSAEPSREGEPAAQRIAPK